MKQLNREASVTCEDVVAEGMHFLRDPLECESVGITVLDSDSG